MYYKKIPYKFYWKLDIIYFRYKNVEQAFAICFIVQQSGKRKIRGSINRHPGENEEWDSPTRMSTQSENIFSAD